MTPQDYARLLRRTSEIRETSYGAKKQADGSWAGPDKYFKSHNQAAEEACRELGFDLSWARITALTIFPGYCDVWDWCDAILGKEE